MLVEYDREYNKNILINEFILKEKIEMFKNVIVRKPAKSMVDGITSAKELGKPDYELAIKQHKAYVETLKKCGASHKRCRL